jgi:hypothetical protein
LGLLVGNAHICSKGTSSFLGLAGKTIPRASFSLHLSSPPTCLILRDWARFSQRQTANLFAPGSGRLDRHKLAGCAGLRGIFLLAFQGKKWDPLELSRVENVF